MATRTVRRHRRKTRAATADVLGQPPATERISSKWRAHFRRLTDLREHILRRQGRLAQEAIDQQPAFSTHMADAGTDTFDRDGTYGKCELTGKPIEPRRLEAIPWTRFSAAAEKQLEREGVVKKARLGPRETVAKTEATTADEDEE